MPTLFDYAQLASIVYKKTEINSLPDPTGWQTVLWDPDAISGFAAGAYRKGNEVVISYTGTNGAFVGTLDFLTGNIPAGAGLPSAQVMRAIEFYLAVRDLNPAR